MRNIVAILIIPIACVIQAIGQNHIPDMTLERDFTAQVKSMDEFFARFNGEETNPELTSSSRENNIVSLFDYNMSHGGLNRNEFKAKIESFVNTVAAWNGKLSIDSVYAETVCSMKYGGKAYNITLVMKREKTSKGNVRWALIGVNGISSLGLYNEKRMAVSPVDHETHFMSFHDIFQENAKYVPSMRSIETEIDDMSFFFGLCISKTLTFIQVNNLRFHVLDVPGYVFTVDEIGRSGTNSGWLISQLLKMDDSKKTEYKSKLINNNSK